MLHLPKKSAMRARADGQGPPPGSIVQKFADIRPNGFTGTPLWQHVLISTARVFGAFLLACAIGIPLALPWG